MIMYDIEDDKDRKTLASYLKRVGFSRVQNSVFLGECRGDKYEKVHGFLSSCVPSDNFKDSIIIVPISADSLRAMTIIGKPIDVDLITGNRNTLFI